MLIKYFRTLKNELGYSVRQLNDLLNGINGPLHPNKDGLEYYLQMDPCVCIQNMDTALKWVQYFNTAPTRIQSCDLRGDRHWSFHCATLTRPIRKVTGGYVTIFKPCQTRFYTSTPLGTGQTGVGPLLPAILAKIKLKPGYWLIPQASWLKCLNWN
jgi:hypothetical protein